MRLGLALSLGSVLSLALVACGQSGCKGSGSGPGAAAADAGAETGGGAGHPEAGAGGSDAGCPDPTQGIPDDIPDGWLRAPCVPADCDIYYAPELSLTRPASPWADCGEGCLELVADWGAPNDRIGVTRGASSGATRYIGYLRVLPNGWEYQILRLPENEVVFDALSPRSGDLGHYTCLLTLRALSTTTAVFRALTGLQDSDPTSSEVLWSVAPGDPRLRLLAEHSNYTTPLEAVAGDGLWLATFGRKSIYWQDMTPSDEMLLAWKSPDSRLAYALSATGTTAFFSANRGHSSYESYAWDQDGGARTLLPFPEAELGGACCVASDGTDMVWLQGSGVFDAGAGTYERVDVMASPHATQAADVEPRWLRQGYADNVNGFRTVVGGGYALHEETRKADGSAVRQHTLTRLSDGAYWVIEPRPGFIWGKPLYVDAEEFALVEGAGPEVFIDAGLHAGYSYTIVRYRIDSLGPPTPAGDPP